jgi:hypothetical protein
MRLAPTCREIHFESAQRVGRRWRLAVYPFVKQSFAQAFPNGVRNGEQSGCLTRIDPHRPHRSAWSPPVPLLYAIPAPETFPLGPVFTPDMAPSYGAFSRSVTDHRGRWLTVFQFGHILSGAYHCPPLSTCLFHKQRAPGIPRQRVRHEEMSHRLTQMNADSLSAFICVHLWLIHSGS